ncbi:hypothetical protein FRC03_011555 [Tulasnella sp. 419]|nr:hypothetical protein FRC02_011739 [Tulasnella sp. 418]KAG8954116.1 hypothetical protein FRC03_011555 [Tulasnella sp. 419]
MTPARIAALDFFDELEERSIIGRVDTEDIEIPAGAMPPDPDDGDNLPSQIHPSFPYGNPFKDKGLATSALPTNPMSTRTLYEDAEFEGVGLKNKRKWKDLGLNMLLPPDTQTEEEAKAKAARQANSAATEPHGTDEEEDADDREVGRSGIQDDSIESSQQFETNGQEDDDSF